MPEHLIPSTQPPEDDCRYLPVPTPAECAEVYELKHQVTDLTASRPGLVTAIGLEHLRNIGVARPDPKYAGIVGTEVVMSAVVTAPVVLAQSAIKGFRRWLGDPLA
jgi:hypothetical protein